MLMTDMSIRPMRSDDYAPLIRVLDDWWGGRRIRELLPQLFFVHFRETSFIAEADGEITGFLAGFFSQTFADEAYIHFVGVNPAHRRHGLGGLLYAHFFDAMRANGRSIVRCVTSPINTTSIVFHTRMGFAPAPSETHNEQDVPYAADYDGPGEHRVLFSKHID